MSATNDGGPAFPNQDSALLNGNRAVYAREGMTLRDYAAIKFIAAIIANPASYDKDGNWLHEYETAAEIGLALADDFIAERNKEAK